MAMVFISYPLGEESLLRGLIVMPKRRFKHLPVVAADVDDRVLAALARIDGIYVHKNDFASYLPILQSLDALADASEPTVVNISLSPGPAPFEPREPVNVASLFGAAFGHLVVIAAGNDGPRERTISPWSIAPWVIGVGATTADGKTLLPESSIGDQRYPLTWPTIVAPGETVVPLRDGGTNAHGTMVGLVLIGKDLAGRNLPGCTDVAFRGTSVSTPKVARICTFILFILRIFLSVDLYLTRKLDDDGATKPASLAWIEELCAEIFERGGIDDHDFGVLAGVSPASLTPILKLLTHLRVSGAHPIDLRQSGTAEVPFPTSVVKRMLTSMARAVPGHGRHQIGAGFVNEEIATGYLSRISALEVASWFTSDAPTLLSEWHESKDPLFDGQLVAEVKRRVNDTTTLSSYKVL